MKNKKSKIALFFLMFSSTIVLQAGGPNNGSPDQPTASGAQSGGALASKGSGDNFLFTGSFLYNYPIDVPPGISGMQPEISLQYNSSGGNSWAGFGWDLSFGAIQRSTKNGKPTYNDQNDTFVYTAKGQSQELIRIPDGSYRSKIEGAFQQFLLQGNSWIVMDKSGMRHVFGDTNNTKITTPQGTFAWMLRQVIDRNGNTMTISYVEHQKNLYPSEILYTSNLITSRPYDRRVNFDYESRPDTSSNYRSGVEQRLERRLQRIETYVYRNGNWDLVKRYQLNYAVGAGRFRSELRSVQLSGHRGTEVVTLPSSTFQYGVAQSQWDVQPSTSIYNLPDAFIVTDTTSPTPPPPNPVSKTRDNGLRFMELNGDGRVDLVRALGPGSSSAWLNTPNGWQPANQWASPEHFSIDVGNGSSLDNGVRAVDLNGDGLTDIVKSISIDHIVSCQIYLNTGSGWSSDQSQWHFPFADGRQLSITFGGTTSNGTWTRDNGVQFSDLNGDGRVDLIQSLLEEDGSVIKKHVWLNNGNGWTQNNNWNLPEFTTIVMPGGGVSRPNGTILSDFNGDGLTDLAMDILFTTNNIRLRKIYLNNGSGFVDVTDSWNGTNGLPAPLTLAGPTGFVRDNGVEFSDINGDGLVDFIQSIADAHGGSQQQISLNNGHGWLDVTNQWPTLPFFSVMNNPTNGYYYYTTGFTFADLNGDSIADLVQAWRVGNTGMNHRKVWFGRVAPQIMMNATNPIGGSTELTYDFTSRLTSGNHKIPFPVSVLTRTITNYGRGTSVPMTYSYFGGLYEPSEREFLGFARVESTDAVGHTSKSYFLQDKDPQGQPAPSNAFKGRGHKTEQFHMNQQLLRSQETLWERTEPWPGVHFVRPQSVTSTLHDGPAPVATKVDTYYDDIPVGPGYGNVVGTYNWGDVASTGDEQAQIVEYAENQALYLLSFPKRTVVLGPSGETLFERKMFYDGSTTLGAITKGNVTRLDTWLNRPVSKWIATRSLYNDYGQVTDVFDAANSRTRTTYTPQGFPDTVTNALNHTARSTYDLGTGNVLTETNVNNQVTQYRYDALGRELKVIGPLDNESFPSAETIYNHNLIGQPNAQFIETRVREEHGQPGTLWSKNYFDGLGRSYKKEQEDVNAGFTLTETQFNNRGLVERVSVPRRISSSGPTQWTFTTYDALGRVKEILKPDSSLTQHGYFGRASYVQDANGKIQGSLVDAYGRVIFRAEPGIATPTIYEYNASGQLSRLTDAQGKVTSFDYDSLGRKLSMTDPNAGHWRYAYDDRGLLTEQTDARGVTLGFRYDALGRLREKMVVASPSANADHAAGDSLARYTYDEMEPTLRPYSRGKLTTVQDASGTMLFSHDALGRVTREVKQVGTLFYDTRSVFDAMGRLKQMTYPSDRIAKYFYNEAGQLDRVTNADQSTVYASYPSYNGLGQTLEMRQSNAALKTTYTYDPLKHVLGSIKTERMAPNATLQHMNYLFDSVGNLQTITDVVNSARNQVFGYDDLYRLTTAAGAYGPEVNTYDNMGNFLTKNGKSYRYDDAAHPYAVTKIISSSAPASDNSTLLAWDLDPSEPIYSLSGNVLKNGVGVSSVAVTLSGNNGQILVNSNGAYQFRGVPGQSGFYTLHVSSIGMLASPSGYMFQPLNQNRTELNFSLYPDTSSILNPALLRTPRTVVGHGGAQGAYSAGAYSGGLIGGQNVGGQILFGSNGWTGRSGFSPLPDGPDTVTHPPQQYVAPPGASVQGVVGPAFVTGQYNQALLFNGLGDTFVFPDSRELAPNHLSLMIWAKPMAAPSSGFATLIAKSTGVPVGQLRDGFRLLMNTSRQVVFEIGSPNGSHVLTSAQTLPLNEWTFVSATYNGAQTKIYFNTTLATTGASSLTLVANLVSASIGSSLDTHRHIAQGTLFQGVLDEPRVQSRAWSASEIAAAYTSFAQFASFTYDANGNGISKRIGPVTTSYRFDVEGRLDRIQENGVTRAEFVYDADGQRVKKITTVGGSAAQTTIYIGKHFEVRPGAMVDHIFAGGQMVADVIATAQPGVQVHYYHTDHLGSTTLVTDASGAVLQELTYCPFGKIHTTSGVSPAKHKYTQQEDDESTGLYYYNARYYDAAIGRFISADTIVPSSVDPQSLNRYAYVNNNPLKFTDPDGHFPWFIPVIAAAVIGGTNGEPFNRHAYSNFNWQTAAIAAASAGAGGWAFSVVGGGFQGAVVSASLSGGVAGGSQAALDGENAFMGFGYGMAGGTISGVISGGLAEIPIHVGKTGLVQTPIPSMAGSFGSSVAMGANGRQARHAGMASLMQGALTNALGFSYEKITGFRNSPVSDHSGKRYVMSRPLGMKIPFLPEVGPVLSRALAVLGIGHMAITDGETSLELYPDNGYGELANYPAQHKNNSFLQYGDSFGTTYQPLTTNQITNLGSSRYNMFLNNSNSAIYRVLSK